MGENIICLLSGNMDPRSTKSYSYELNKSNIPTVSSVTSVTSVPSTIKVTSWYRGWSVRKKVLISAIITMLLLSAIISAAVVGIRAAGADQYPNYAPLNYNLVDTYRGTTFFDSFNFYSGPDPTWGYVE